MINSQQTPIAQVGRRADIAFDSSFTMRRYPLLQPILEGEAEARTIADRVYDRILLRIVRGEFQGGCELKSTELAAE